MRVTEKKTFHSVIHMDCDCGITRDGVGLYGGATTRSGLYL